MRDILEKLTTHKWLQAGIVLAAALSLAYLALWLVGKVLRITRKTHTDLDDRIVQALRRPIFLTVIFLGLSWTADLLELASRPRFLAFAVLKTLAIFVWTLAGLRISYALLTSVSNARRPDSLVQPRTVPIFDMLIKIAATGIAVYFFFLAWNIDVTAWLASAGIVGIAVGFAAKDSLANLFSGIFILADAPYKVGDFIVLDQGLRGQVTRIGMRSTRVLTRDDIEVTIPNALIANSKIINEAGGPHIKQRVRVRVSAAYGSDVDTVRAVLIGCKDNVNDVCQTPEPVVRLRELGGSGLHFELLVWIEDAAARGRVLDVLHTRIYKAFAQAKIEIPYTKMDVQIREMPRP